VQLADHGGAAGHHARGAALIGALDLVLNALLGLLVLLIRRNGDVVKKVVGK
jgi:hypothetical protein